MDSSSAGSLRRHASSTHRARRERGRAHRPQVPSWATRSRSTPATPPARSRTTARSSSSTRSTTARARPSRRSSRTRISRGGRSHPREHLRGARRLAEAPRRSRHPRRGRGRQRQARCASSQGRARLERDAQRPCARFKALASALREQPHHAETRAEMQRIADVSNAWKALTELYESIGENLTDAALARSYWMLSARIEDEALGLVDDAAKGYMHVLSLDPARRGSARRARGALHAHAALERPHRRHRASHRADGRPGRSRAALRADGAHLRRAARSPRRRGLFVQAGPRARPRKPDRALRARRALHAPAYVERPRREPRSAARARGLRRRADRADAAPRGASRDARCSSSSRRSRAIDRCSSATSGTSRRSALSSVSARSGARARDRRPLEPLYRQIGDYRKLIGAHEVQVRRSEDPNRRVELLHQIAQLYEDAAADLEQRVRDARAGPSRGPGERADAAADRSRGPRHRSLRGPRAGLSAARLGGRQDDPQLGAALTMMSARVYEGDIGDVERRSGSIARSWSSTAPISRPPSRSSVCSGTRSGTRISR